MKYHNAMPALPSYTTFLEVVNHSIKVLYTHGFITRAEREKIWQRVEEDYCKEMKGVEDNGK